MVKYSHGSFEFPRELLLSGFKDCNSGLLLHFLGLSAYASCNGHVGGCVALTCGATCLIGDLLGATLSLNFYSFFFLID